MARLADFGLGLLFEVFLGKFGELLRLQFELLARGSQIGHRCRQPALGVQQLLLMPFQRRNVGSDRDIAAVLGAALIDL